MCASASASVCVFACVCCGINPFTGVWPESTGVNAAAGAASRKTFVTFALRAAPSGNAPAACYAGGLLCVLAPPTFVLLGCAIYLHTALAN